MISLGAFELVSAILGLTAVGVNGEIPQPTWGNSRVSSCLDRALDGDGDLLKGKADGRSPGGG